MRRVFWIKVKEDWNRQPLTILVQIASVLAAIAIAIVSFSSVPALEVVRDETSVPTAVPQASVQLALSILLASALATASGRIFRRTVIGGFFGSLIFATLSIGVFSVSSKAALLKTTAVLDAGYAGPLTDLIYWAVFSVFVGICAAPAMARIMETWGQMSSRTEDGTETTRGVTPVEVLILAALWGWVLSETQQMVIGAFVFEQPPIAATRAS